jgi:hypothetical protein
MRRLIGTFIFLIVSQAHFGQSLVEIPPVQAEGLPIQLVEIYVIEDGVTRILKEKEYEDFIDYFHLKNKGPFHPLDYKQTKKLMLAREEVVGATYKTFNDAFYGPLTIRWYITVGTGDEGTKTKGLMASGDWKELPLLYEDEQSELTFIFNGGLGAFLDNNGFFGEGAAFTQGNPIADKPADFGATYWTEAYLEPGVGGISELGSTDIYVYGALSAMFTTRIGNDLFSSGSTVFADFERAYAGILVPRLGKNNIGKLDISVGRNFFQLNDGFLFSKFAGSANAGDRGSVYLNARTAFQKTALATYTSNKWTIRGFFVEPQELFRESQTNTNYTGATIGYNDSKNFDLNLTVLQRTNGLGQYRLPNGESISKKGLWVINPKVWVNNILNEGLFLKSEFAYETKTGMRAYGWYAGGGIQRNDIKFKPSLYYRYAFMQGDDPTTSTYERYDPLLSSGLGNWVQGINFRKIVGNGNIISHRIELKGSLSEKWQLAMDAFFLRGDELNNLGGLAPISNLTARDFGQEYTLNLRYFINRHFLLQTVFSHAVPQNAVTNNLPDSKPWQTLQFSLFMFY